MKMLKVSDMVGIINKFAPFAHAEEWDNVGLQVGDPAAPVRRIAVALDGERDAIDFAIAQGCNLLLTHHPLIFTPLKKLSYTDPTGKLVALAVKHDLAVLSLHTNYDLADGGMNDLLAARLGVEQVVLLRPAGGDELVKLIVFVPQGHEEALMEALFPFCGVMGNYRDCSFRTAGTGTFRPLDGAHPHIGRVGRRESVEEMRLEIQVRKASIAAAVNALLKAHPYEEPAYDLVPTLNRGATRGLGRIGMLAQETTLGAFAGQVRERLGSSSLRYVGEPGRRVKKVALCGGSGMSLLRDAHRQGADVLVTGDAKYHEARMAQELGIAVIDAGHFATESLMIEGVATVVRRELAANGYEGEVLPWQGGADPFRGIE
jgi:dinuclear metal center YbgI/SA1388 family protein